MRTDGGELPCAPVLLCTLDYGVVATSVGRHWCQETATGQQGVPGRHVSNPLVGSSLGGEEPEGGPLVERVGGLIGPRPRPCSLNPQTLSALGFS